MITLAPFLVHVWLLADRPDASLAASFQAGYQPLGWMPASKLDAGHQARYTSGVGLPDLTLPDLDGSYLPLPDLT